MISDKSLLCVFLSLLWIVTNVNAKTTKEATTQAATTQPTTVETTVRTPGNVEAVSMTNRSESSITLSWDKVENIPTYTLKYENNGPNEEKIDQTSGTTISHVVTSLTAGTKYTFTVITTRDGLSSTGTKKETFTLPRNAEDFKAIDQNKTSIILQWNKVENNKYLLQYGSIEENITVSEDTFVKTISNLQHTTEYYFSLFTLFEDVNSSGVHLRAYTAPPNPEGLRTVGQNDTSITLQWNKVGDLLKYIIEYEGSKVEVFAEAGQTNVTREIQGLTPAKEYSFTLFAVFNSVTSSGRSYSAVTAPSDTDLIRLVKQDETNITLQWEKVGDLLEYIISINGSEKHLNASADQDLVTYTASGLTAATEYHFVVFVVFKNVKSKGADFSAVTAPRNAEDFKVVGQNETSITLQWTEMNDLISYKLQYEESEINITASEHQVTVSGLTNTTKYNFTLFTVFKNVESSGVIIPAATAPPNTENIDISQRKETSITLQWKTVRAVLKYRIEYDSKLITVSALPGVEEVSHIVSGLTSGTRYEFKVFAVFENISSSGKTSLTATAPSRVASVSVTKRSVNDLTLEWKNERKDWSYSIEINWETFTPDASKDVVSQVIRFLEPGKKYPFRVITSFSGLTATYESFTVTTIDCENAKWVVTNSSINAKIEGLFTKATASNQSQTHNSLGESDVLFTGLYPGATYKVSLEYESDSILFNQCNHTVIIKPPNLKAHCEYWDKGYSIYVGWDKPAGIWTRVEVNVGEESYFSQKGEQSLTIPGFQPATTHLMSVTSVSGKERSTSYVLSCTTDPRGVIAGSFFGVLIFLILVCLAAFVFLKRPDIISRNKPFIGGTKKSNKPKAIPVGKFPEHFYQLGMDENRGFSQEYESLMPVGTEQTRKDALLPENKPKNRFSNVLPYDWCRVKLTSSDVNGTSDYINANYMPGFKTSREFIATQGPLPSTVDDFWRMIWEQRVKGIVMVTNCKESGKTKCEQYWPEDRKHHLYGELTVLIKSEEKEPNWTLREFGLKHKNYSEERTVKHFHFTAWPDHGVPQGTKYLIQFRGLVREHIDREGTGAPTVVHCSAGVGRTGTIIALDVLLQQLEKKQAVDIKGFVHNMRLNRPHMVQTESQYVFLHQCIMDTLQQKEISEEDIYENDDMLYANATALREFHKGSQV